MENLIIRYPCLAVCKDDIRKAIDTIIDSYKNGGKLLLCGNGGSCADCEHIVGELMKGFLSKRPISISQKLYMKRNNPNLTDEVLSKLQLAVPAVALPSFSGLNSAFCNDVDAELIYAQSLMGLGAKCDVVFCISTSGNSKNCVAAANVAKGLGLTVVALTGQTGGKLKEIADICICAPEIETYKVQELHLPIYHLICMEIEKEFFG
ncbi:MAG: SIS domain-containing protein [Clostridia bacterium]|nr:SIS domain-containing protein [Clostridia bacterium]